MVKETEIIALRRHFQFLVLLGLFLPIVFEALFNGADKAFNNTLLSWSSVMVFYIGIFLFLEFFANKLRSFLFNICHLLVIVNIFMFIPVLSMISSKGIEGKLSYSENLFYMTTLSLLSTIPMAVFLLLATDFSFWILKRGYKSSKLDDKLRNKA